MNSSMMSQSHCSGSSSGTGPSESVGMDVSNFVDWSWGKEMLTEEIVE